MPTRDEIKSHKVTKKHMGGFQLGNTFGIKGRPREWTEKEIEVVGIALDRWFEDPENYYFDKFLNETKLTAEHFADFEKRSPSFAETLSRARKTQEQRIVTGSMNRKYDGNFAKFVLANRAGWREKTEVSGDQVNPLNFVLSAIDGKTKDIIIEPDLIDNNN